MVNPTIILKKANQLVPTKPNKKGFRPRHYIALDDKGELFLTIVINSDKGKFYRVDFGNNTRADTFLDAFTDDISKMVKKYPVK